MIDLACFIAGASRGLDEAITDPFTPYLQWLSPAVGFLLGADAGARGCLGVYRAAKRAAPAEASPAPRIGTGPEPRVPEV